MKTSVSTYSFIKLINSGELSQIDCISQAKKIGFDAVEIESIRPHDKSSEKEYAQKIANELKAQNMPISNFTFSSDFLNGSGGEIDMEIKHVCEMIDIAHILGAKSVRHDATTGFYRQDKPAYTFESVLPILARACKEVTEYASSLGIKTMIENHGFFCQDSERVEKLYAAVNDDNFGLLTDMGNFLCVDESSIHALGRLAPYARYVHAKDFYVRNTNPGKGFFQTRGGNYLRGAIIGHGEVPIAQCLRILKNVGYDGTVSIEFEGMEDPINALTIGLENLKRFIAEL